MVSKAWIASLFLATAYARAIDGIIHERQLENKQVLVGSAQFESLAAPLTESLPEKLVTYKRWPTGYVPEACMKVNVGGKDGKVLNPEDFQVLVATYEDCEQPWVICRHKNANITRHALINAISRIPVRMRQYIGNFIAVPEETHPGWAAWAYGNVVVSQTGSGWNNLGMLAHEISHVLDNYPLSPKPGKERFSSGADFKKATSKDAKVVTRYGRDNGYVEEFAEVGRMAIYNRNVPGGLHGAGIDFSGIQNQMALYEWRAGDIIVANGVCTKDKVQSSGAVKIGAASFKGDPEPDTAGSGSTPADIEGEIYHSHA